MGVNSGTSALHLALICAGVRPGDEVITVPMTFVATTWAISYVGARPVSSTSIRSRTRWTCARWSGRSRAEPGRFCQFTCTGSLPIWVRCWRSEAAAASPSSRMPPGPWRPLWRTGGRHARSLRLLQLLPGKNLGAYGELGAVTTDDESIAERVRRLRDHAQSRATTTPSSASIIAWRLPGGRPGRQAQLSRPLDEARLGSLIGTAKSSPGWLKLPVEPLGESTPGISSSCFIPTETESAVSWTPGDPDGAALPVPVHLQEAYADLEHRPGDFPIAERVASDCLASPSSPR